MYLHIGDNILVKKREIIGILDARKWSEVEKDHSLLKNFEKSQLDYLHQSEETIKSLVILVPWLQRRLKQRKRRKNKYQKPAHIILVSSISPTTLKERVQRSESPIPGQILVKGNDLYQKK